MNMTCREHYALNEENVQPDREQLHDETNNANCMLEHGEPLLEILTTLQIDSDGDCSSSSTKENGIWCSKNVLRKKRHWEKIVAAKKSKRKLEKEKKKAKQAENANAGTNPQQHSKRFLKAITKERVLGAKDTGPRLCVDLSMTMHMSRKEISRLAAQIRRLYGSNKKAAKPFWLYLTGFVEHSLLYDECVRMNDGFINYLINKTENCFLDVFPLEKIIYLTPDADNALKDIDPQKVYVLGGLVDESIQKKLTYHKARENGLQTARLPIPEYMVKNVNLKNFHSEILAINQVFDVLATYLETQSWPDALKAGVPPGKGFLLRDPVK
ncbi:tRNA methyltransferase 10 homolog B [Pelobates cultripes]|uniref:tRNA methyltransferase 10 homolog B n=1 Tax=Pelobates cultripes TaxID=61616 RepID=A0AAD1S6C8_PELCU|nr:tRNA methyltransferase 10 homolog B [Pelobates cultripes]